MIFIHVQFVLSLTACLNEMMLLFIELNDFIFASRFFKKIIVYCFYHQWSDATSGAYFVMRLSSVQLSPLSCWHENLLISSFVCNLLFIEMLYHSKPEVFFTPCLDSRRFTWHNLLKVPVFYCSSSLYFIWSSNGRWS